MTQYSMVLACFIQHKVNLFPKMLNNFIFKHLGGSC